MFALFGVDVWGPYRVSLVLALLSRLQHEPRSVMRARSLGGDEWFGYGLMNAQLANLLDGQTLQTKVTSQATKPVRLKDSERAPRPQPKKTSRTISSRDASSVAAVFAALG